MLRLVTVIVLFTASTACGAKSAAAPATVRPPAVGAGDYADAIKWVRNSAEYHAALTQVYRQATARVESEARGHVPGSWAVVLDADETVISNLTYQLERAGQGLGFSRDSWKAWVERREAIPLPGAATFLDRVRELGGRTAIVTNRLQSECTDTEAVFTSHKLQFDAMLCRPDDGPSDKNPRFRDVAAGRTRASAAPLEIVAFVGDNILDFPAMTQADKQRGDAAFADFGVRFFLVPNPMYGSWQ